MIKMDQKPYFLQMAGTENRCYVVVTTNSEGTHRMIPFYETKEQADEEVQRQLDSPMHWDSVGVESVDIVPKPYKKP